MMILRYKLIIGLLLFGSTAMMSQLKLFTLEDLNFGGTRYSEMSPEKRYYIWCGDKLIRKYIDRVVCISDKGTERELFSLDDLQEAFGDEKYLIGVNLLNVEFPYKDKPVALVITPEKRILFDYSEKKISFSQGCKGSLEWCPISCVDVFSSDNNLWIRKADGTERQLTKDGSRDIVYGRSVHRNEFGITKGTFWSPDGKKVAFYRMDQSMVTDYPQVNTFSQPIATYEPDKYPMAGQVSHKVTIGIYDIDSDTTSWLDLGDVTDRYFTNISWAPDGHSLYLIELNRDQNHAELAQYDAVTGVKMRVICTEKDEKYVEPQHPIAFLPWDDSKFIYWSQQEGYWHLYLYDAKKGECLKTLTKGAWVVTDIVGFDSETRSVVFRANKENLLQYNLYAVNVQSGKITLLDNGVGSHNGIASVSGKYILDQWSSPDVPRAWAVLDVANNTRKELGESPNPWKGYSVPIIRQGALKAADEKTTLYYRMVLPSDFDETKKFPTIVYVYGGPHAHNVEATWHWNFRSWEIYMAQKGYIVFVLDNRGSENRGKEFEQTTFRQLGQIEMQDQMKGIDYLRSLPYVDSNRIGVHGWSYGGFMTISLMTNYPDVFKVGVAGGPVIDWSKYEVMYTERYMDTPEQNSDGYAKTCLVDKAEKLKGRLLMITGMNDPVVVPQNSLMFLNACNEVGTYPDFYVYPGEEHNMQGHQSVHLHEKITRYFEDYLK